MSAQEEEEEGLLDEQAALHLAQELAQVQVDASGSKEQVKEARARLLQYMLDSDQKEMTVGNVKITVQHKPQTKILDFVVETLRQEPYEWDDKTIEAFLEAVEQNRERHANEGSDAKPTLMVRVIRKKSLLTKALGRNNGGGRGSISAPPASTSASAAMDADAMEDLMQPGAPPAAVAVAAQSAFGPPCSWARPPKVPFAPLIAEEPPASERAFTPWAGFSPVPTTWSSGVVEKRAQDQTKTQTKPQPRSAASGIVQKRSGRPAKAAPKTLYEEEMDIEDVQNGRTRPTFNKHMAKTLESVI
jgi:hypothetical protein